MTDDDFLRQMLTVKELGKAVTAQVTDSHAAHDARGDYRRALEAALALARTNEERAMVQVLLDEWKAAP